MARTLPAVIAIFTALVAIDDARAAEPTGSKLLSDGIVAVYHGRNDLAIQHLDAAQAVMPRDPRVYFFRGIAKWRQGQRWDGEADFRTGAHIEVALGRIDIGRALHRIQGAERLAIETLRREARALPAEVVQQAVPPFPQRAVATRRPSRATRTQIATPNLPSNTPDDSDPFSQTSSGFLGRGEVRRSEPAANQIAADDPYGLRLAGAEESIETLADDEPVGTGVAAFADEDVDAEMTAADDIAEFASDSYDPSADPDPFSVDDEAVGPAPGGDAPTIFGAALRALTRGLTPTLPAPPRGQGILERLTGAGGPPDMQPPPPDDFFGPGDPVDAPTTQDEDFGDPFQDE